MPWSPTSSIAEEWGRLQVIFGGKDVTDFRGVEAQVEGWSDQEPYGSGPAQLTFPQITELDSVGSGDLSWCVLGADVSINKVNPDGSAGGTLWSGFSQRFGIASNISSGALTVELAGCFQGQAALYAHQPYQSWFYIDIGRQLIRTARRLGFRVRHIPMTEIGIMTRIRGDRSQTMLDYLDQLLALMGTPDGGQYTLLRDAVDPRLLRLVLKDRTTEHFTVYAGGQGVALDLSQDITQAPNRYYGEGVGQDGCRWGNKILPNLKPETVPPWGGVNLDIGSTGTAVEIWQLEVASDGYDVGTVDVVSSGVFAAKEAAAAEELQRRAGLPVTGIVDHATWNATWANGANSANLGGARFDPIAADPRTVRFFTTSNGSYSTPNPAYTRAVIPVETFIAYGEGTSKADGTRSARAELARYSNGPGTAGTITLTADPPEMHRLDIRAGMNVRVKFLHGTTGVLMHVADVQVNPQANPVQVRLTVDEKARDLLSIAQILDRDRESRQDPAKNYINLRRRSAITRDQVITWDCEAGSGQIPRRSCPGGQWSVFRIAAGEAAGTLQQIDVQTVPAAAFAFEVFAGPVSAAHLHSMVPAPLTARSDGYQPFDVPGIQDELDRLGYVDGFGGPNQAGGYWPGEQTSSIDGTDHGHPITGRLRVDSSTTFLLKDPPYLWVAVFPLTDTAIQGTLKLLTAD